MGCFNEGIGAKIPYPAYPDAIHTHLLPYLSYAAFVYGILYANLAGFSIAFEEVRGWGLVTGTLPFLAIFVGILGAAVMNL